MKISEANTKHFTRKTLAQRWEVSEMFLKRKERKGDLKPLLLGDRIVRYRLEDILKIEEEAQA